MSVDFTAFKEQLLVVFFLVVFSVRPVAVFSSSYILYQYLRV